MKFKSNIGNIAADYIDCGEGSPLVIITTTEEVIEIQVPGRSLNIFRGLI